MTTTIETYKTLRASGLTELEACEAMMRDHGLTCEQAAALSWQAVGKRAPHRDDHRAVGAYYARMERAHYDD
jgi:hypothetical protein